LKAALGQTARASSREADRLRDFDNMSDRDVSSLDEVRLVQGVVNRFATRLGVGHLPSSCASGCL